VLIIKYKHTKGGNKKIYQGCIQGRVKNVHAWGKTTQSYNKEGNKKIYPWETFWVRTKKIYHGNSKSFIHVIHGSFFGLECCVGKDNVWGKADQDFL
jgi:hypothetical protein